LFRGRPDRAATPRTVAVTRPVPSVTLISHLRIDDALGLETARWPPPLAGDFLSHLRLSRPQLIRVSPECNTISTGTPRATANRAAAITPDCGDTPPRATSS